MTLKVPLTNSMPEAYAPVKKVTKVLRTALSEIYASYAIGFWAGKLMPRWFLVQTIEKVTEKYTIGFSNTPGPLKPFIYKNPTTGSFVRNISSQSYLMTAGRLGFIVCAVSQSGFLRLTLCSDELICDQKTNSRIMQMLLDNIHLEIERTRDMPENKKD